MIEVRDGARRPCSSTFGPGEPGQVTHLSEFSFFLGKKEEVSPDLHSLWGCLKVSQMTVCILHRHGGLRQMQMVAKWTFYIGHCTKHFDKGILKIKVRYILNFDQ